MGVKDMDMSSLAIQQYSEMQLRHPVSGELMWADDEKTIPRTITIASRASEEYKASMKGWTDLASKSKGGKASPELNSERATHLLVAVCKGSSYVMFDGVEPQTKAEFKRILDNPSYGWLKDQIDEHLGDTGNFIN